MKIPVQTGEQHSQFVWEHHQLVTAMPEVFQFPAMYKANPHSTETVLVELPGIIPGAVLHHTQHRCPTFLDVKNVHNIYEFGSIVTITHTEPRRSLLVRLFLFIDED
jgi:hypothetical protein